MKFVLAFTLLFGTLAWAGGWPQENQPRQFPLHDSEKECPLSALSQSVDPFRILQAPDEFLTRVSTPLPWKIFDTNWLRELVLRMTRTLLESGGVGLAAPQIGQNSRIFLVRVTEKHLERHPLMQPRPLTVFINPSMEVLDAQLHPYREGCLSLPGKTGIVYRSRKIRLHWQDVEGESYEEIWEGPNAVIAQHENDHLNGVLISTKWSEVEDNRK